MTIKITRNRVALAIAAAVAAIAGVSYAAIPAANGTISACKDNKGSLKVIDAESGQACGGNQQLLTWNQQGQPGPAGLSGVEMVTGGGSASSTAVRAAFAFCPAGKKVVGGGAKAFTTYNSNEFNVPQVALTQSYPSGNTGWGAYANEVSQLESEWTLRAYAICANVGS